MFYLFICRCWDDHFEPIHSPRSYSNVLHIGSYFCHGQIQEFKPCRIHSEMVDVVEHNWSFFGLCLFSQICRTLCHTSSWRPNHCSIVGNNGRPDQTHYPHHQAFHGQGCVFDIIANCALYLFLLYPSVSIVQNVSKLQPLLFKFIFWKFYLLPFLID